MENLKFAVEMFDAGGSLIEMLGRLHDLDAAKASQKHLMALPKEIPRQADNAASGRADLAVERSGMSPQGRFAAMQQCVQ
jgi:hypothetical protein